MDTNRNLLELQSVKQGCIEINSEGRIKHFRSRIDTIDFDEVGIKAKLAVGGYTQVLKATQDWQRLSLKGVGNGCWEPVWSRRTYAIEVCKIVKPNGEET